MNLKYEKSYNSNSVLVKLSLIKFTDNEIKAIEILGGPELEISKTYDNTQTEISINKQIAPDFSVEEYFYNESKGLTDAIKDAEAFIEDVHSAIAYSMTNLMDTYNPVKTFLNNRVGEIFINDGESSQLVSKTSSSLESSPVYFNF